MIQKKLLLSTAICLLASPLNAERTYTVKSGDTLLKVLKSEGFEGDFMAVYPRLKEVRELNGRRFAQGSLDLIYPGEQIVIPTAYVEPEPEPEPIPEPVVVEAEPNYVGKAWLGRSQAELIRDSKSEVITNQVDLIIQDTLRTDVNGRAEIELNDSSEYVVGPNSEFTIEDFDYQPSTTDKFVARLNLLIGSISVKTGKIGKKATDSYLLKTPAASMGVRGTEYTIRYCEGDDCGALKGATAAVKDGSIVFKTAAGEVEVPKGKFVQVESLGAPAKVGDIPEGFFDLDKKPSDISLSWFEKIKKFASDLTN